MESPLLLLLLLQEVVTVRGDDVLVILLQIFILVANLLLVLLMVWRGFGGQAAWSKFVCSATSSFLPILCDEISI